MSSRRGSSSSLGSSNSSSSSFEFLESEDDDLVVLPDVLSDDADTDGGVAVNVEARASAGAFPSDHHDEDAQVGEMGERFYVLVTPAFSMHCLLEGILQARVAHWRLCWLCGHALLPCFADYMA